MSTIFFIAKKNILLALSSYPHRFSHDFPLLDLFNRVFCCNCCYPDKKNKTRKIIRISVVCAAKIVIESNQKTRKTVGFALIR